MPITSIAMPSATSTMPKCRAAWVSLSTSLLSLSLSKTWKIVKPKLISDSEVRITDISVRSALMRVRWNDIPVRRAASSSETRLGSNFVTLSTSLLSRLSGCVPIAAFDPPVGDAGDRPANQKIRHHGQHKGDHERFDRIEGAEHPKLIDRVHPDAQQDDARRREQRLEKPAAPLRRIAQDGPEIRRPPDARVLDPVEGRGNGRHHGLQKKAERHRAVGPFDEVVPDA